ncbi:Uncharacterized protein TPAR_01548 [Tolypocladium paradoxum]|uniref:Actin-like ATPase domain-containing protein n=1 Tax=Tolypocladium paradoxum TaxID=94208 RepID=A0A2S4L718_9HYPO|nr:Uncharacterized protein TPAR_01548 [Tolypocladium paradoxum]
MPPKYKPIVIGFDFGTTYSGMAWAPEGSHITAVSGFPSRFSFNHDKEKAPTAIAYQQAGKPPLWGYDIPPNEIPLKWVKLLLLDDEDLPEHVRNSNHVETAKTRLKQSNKHPVEAIGDYMREFWKHGYKDIERSVGKSRVDASKFELVVTLPAIWPSYARMRLRKAIELAGLLDARPAGETNLSFISEPEAAALATMQDFVDRAAFEKNDHFVVCDAGGGTVDIISYKVMRETPPKIRESVQGDGKLCGAVFLDEGFLELLKSKMPPDVRDKIGVSDVQWIMNQFWENGMKPQFHGNNEPFVVPVPYGGRLENHFQSPALDFNRKNQLSRISRLTSTRHELSDIYKPVVAEVAALVCSQIRKVIEAHEKPPKYLILVGGFGKSTVLYDSLRTAIDEVSEKTEILQARGEKPWTAVCRGAVMKGVAKCEPNPCLVVEGRVARASFGTTFNVLPWEVDEHDIRDKAWCPVQREFLAVDQTKWFIRIGETLWDEEPICHAFWQDLEKPTDSIETELVYSTAHDPPDRCDASVKRLCMIRWSKVPAFDSLPTWENKKQKVFRHICYEVKMVTDGASLDFQIFYEGNMVASKNVDVDFTGSGTAYRP